MKKIIFIALAGVFVALASCSTHHHPHGMPPGQAKKITGSKSAKPYAPGQQKKK